MPLDSEVEIILSTLAEQGGSPLHELSPEDMRALYKTMTPPPPDVKLAEVRDLDCPGPAGNIALRLYRPSEKEGLPVVMFFHGGGWVIGDLDTHDALCRQLAAFSGVAVVAVDYRLAPEHPYPAAYMDCYEASYWVRRNTKELGVDEGKIFVAGDSAGGNLAAAVALHTRHEGAFIIRGQVLIYPVLDCDFDTESYQENAEGYLLTRDAMRWFWDNYTNDVSRTETYAAPLRESAFRLLPPALIVTAEFDPLRDEGQAYASRLEESGVDTELAHYQGVIHGFVQMNAQIPTGLVALKHCADWIKDRT